MKNLVKSICIALLLVFLSGACHAQELVKSNDLKKLLIGSGKGSTWVIANGNNTRISFNELGEIIDCWGKLNFESCDTGTYIIEGDGGTRTYNKLFRNEGGIRKFTIKKVGEDLFFGDSKVSKYSETPTLTKATEEQIRSMAGKSYVYIKENDGEVTTEFRKDMSFFSCSKSGCGTTDIPKIKEGLISFTYNGETGSSVSAPIYVEEGKFLWRGKPMQVK